VPEAIGFLNADIIFLPIKVGRIVLAGGILEGPGAQKCAGGGAIAHQGNMEESSESPLDIGIGIGKKEGADLFAHAKS